MRLFRSFIMFLVCIFLSGPLWGGMIDRPDSQGFVDVDNGRLYYEQFGTQGTPIIMIHGGPGLDHGLFLPYMIELAKDHIVILYDQRGSGKSLEGPIGHPTISMEQFVEDLEDLRKKFGFNKMVVLGHSWGGLVAMNYALEYPQRVLSLILVDSAPASASEYKSFMLNARKRLAADDHKLQAIEQSQEFKEGDPETTKIFYKTLFQNYLFKKHNIEKLNLDRTAASVVGGTQVFELLRENYLENYDLMESLKTLHIPTLIIYGDQDIVPLWMAKKTQGALPNASLKIIDDAGHFSYMENPAAFFKAVRDFLKK